MSCLTWMNRLNWIAGSPHGVIVEAIENGAVCGLAGMCRSQCRTAQGPTPEIRSTRMWVM